MSIVAAYQKKHRLGVEETIVFKVGSAIVGSHEPALMFSIWYSGHILLNTYDDVLSWSVSTPPKRTESPSPKIIFFVVSGSSLRC